ncbi:hypothetical protein L1987_61097 [Smallanthus sonchifolius]|uniref:Uncharacterized protein n=1 Tax=Smallanthus sonchifolius TaxID=185202 RepID=A0ACB9D9V0_9ASTR|nr:hypothetical protein L1987_61097 [Smallanthus sonchifolius]
MNQAAVCHLVPMDIGVSATIDVNKSHGLSMYTLESTNEGTEDLSVNKLQKDVIESLNIDRDRVLGSKPPSSKYDFQKKDNTIGSSCSCSTSLPMNLKLVSAMKGSREKQRAGPPQKLTVKWAPEVYDPVPTSVSHAVTNKPQKQSKKNSKSKQKNGSKSSRGNKHKDKSARKRGGV